MRQNLGQHFLRNEKVLKKIAELLDPRPGEIILEIGPGHGELTQAILAREPEVKIIALERDPALAEEVSGRFGQVEVRLGDALRTLAVAAAGLTDYKLAGNIPYYLTGHLLRAIGDLEQKPSLSVLTIQKEVAERLAAKPPEMNRLAAAVQFWAEPKIAGLISRNDFSPPPEVDSATVLLKTRRNLPAEGGAGYYRTMHALFQQPRKTIENNLRAATGLGREEIEREALAAGVNPGLRPQNLSVENIRSLAAELEDKIRKSPY